jgi:peptidyl-prolyl cis-trans isomerase SDCCAG10
VACANNGSKNSNDSQFIITLDRADELHGKHTLFGRCVGDSIYNVLKIGEKELDSNERPLYPPKIKAIRIVDNPFPDIIPRITAAEKRAQQRAREEAQKEREEAARRKGAKKDVKLLSFGADEEAEEEPPTKLKKNMARPDLVEHPESGPAQLPDFSTLAPPTRQKPTRDVQSGSLPQEKPTKEKSQKDIDITKIREKHAKEKASAASVLDASCLLVSSLTYNVLFALEIVNTE